MSAARITNSKVFTAYRCNPINNKSK